jgi:hypothetical protein
MFVKLRKVFKLKCTRKLQYSGRFLSGPFKGSVSSHDPVLINPVIKFNFYTCIDYSVADPDNICPNPIKKFGSERIRIRNTNYRCEVMDQLVHLLISEQVEGDEARQAKIETRQFLRA